MPTWAPAAWSCTDAELRAALEAGNGFDHPFAYTVSWDNLLHDVDCRLGGRVVRFVDHIGELRGHAASCCAAKIGFALDHAEHLQTLLFIALHGEELGGLNELRDAAEIIERAPYDLTGLGESWSDLAREGLARGCSFVGAEDKLRWLEACFDFEPGPVRRHLVSFHTKARWMAGHESLFGLFAMCAGGWWLTPSGVIADLPSWVRRDRSAGVEWVAFDGDEELARTALSLNEASELELKDALIAARRLSLLDKRR